MGRSNIEWVWQIWHHVSGVLCNNSVSILSHLQIKRSQHSQECKDPRRHCFMTRNLDLWPLEPKINGFPGLIVEHLYVKFGNLSCSGFWYIVRKNWHRQTVVNTLFPQQSALVYISSHLFYTPFYLMPVSHLVWVNYNLWHLCLRSAICHERTVDRVVSGHQVDPTAVQLTSSVHAAKNGCCSRLHAVDGQGEWPAWYAHRPSPENYNRYKYKMEQKKWSYWLRELKIRGSTIILPDWLTELRFYVPHDTK